MEKRKKTRKEWAGKGKGERKGKVRKGRWLRPINQQNEEHFNYKLAFIIFFCLGLFSHNNRYVSQIRENNHFTNSTVAYTDNQSVDTKLAKKWLYVRTPLAFPFSIPFFSSCDKSKWGSGWMGGVEEKEKKK